ncbi:hypothetical protein Acr_00g0049570 [Actinidia rufa]|uniref:Retrotransposon Copia-like N-terminal domain-containing protein n=1 Tax=Actinidia rufa TaxID=165716 RepID=A0A7J0DKH2_9ERIC|nr:hypothetical protein Acr_00g0049570 [Actinidia rufa]
MIIFHLGNGPKNHPVDFETTNPTFLQKNGSLSGSIRLARIRQSSNSPNPKTQQPPLSASCAALDSHLRNQTASNPASCVASVQPLQPPQPPNSHHPQPPNSLCAAPACAATIQPPTTPLCSPCLRSHHPASAQPLCTRRQQPLCSPCAAQPTLPTAPAPAQVAPAHMVPVSNPVPVSLSHSQPAQRVTSVLLNGKNFHAWSRSFQLYLGGKRKTRWILGKEPKPAESNPKFDEWVSDNCIILGWMFNSMENRVYHMFMYHDTVHGFVVCVDPDTKWEELAQYEPLSDFSSDGAVESKCLDRRHTYQFLMGLKSEFETLRTQILNTSPLPSLYEAFAIVDDQRAFAAAQGLTYIVSTVASLVILLIVVGGGRGRGTPRTGAVAEVESIPANLPDFKQLQLQIAQLQSHLGLATASQSSGPTAAIVAETPIALHDEPIPPRPLPILEPTSSTPTPKWLPVPNRLSGPQSPRSSSLASIFSGVRYVFSFCV